MSFAFTLVVYLFAGLAIVVWLSAQRRMQGSAIRVAAVFLWPAYLPLFLEPQRGGRSAQARVAAQRRATRRSGPPPHGRARSPRWSGGSRLAHCKGADIDAHLVSLDEEIDRLVTAKQEVEALEV
jgi:hypothetical protein